MIWPTWARFLTLFLLTLLLTTGLISRQAISQSESAITVKQTDVEGPTNVPGSDVDQILTNNYMRAQSGSKSRWSIASGLNYNGGDLSSPFAENRPNIAGSTGTTDKSLVSGDISGKYSLTSTQSIFAGVGVRWLTPFQGTAKPNDYSGDKFDADNPYLNYQYVYKWLDFESVVTLASTYFTDSNLVAQGYLVSFGLSQNTVYKIPKTHLSVGTFAYVGLAFYDKNDFIDEQNQSDYSAGFEPFVEYQITDRLNFRTSWNLWIFEHIRSETDANTYRWDKVTQSLGLGISVTRDIFLYPNIQFLPDEIRADRTNVALNTNINLF